MSRFDSSESVRKFDEEVEKLRGDMSKRREDFWKEAEDRESKMEAERERWLKRTDDLWNDMVESSRMEFENFGKFGSEFENAKDEVRKEKSESFSSRRSPDRDEEGREFLANFRSKLRSDPSKDNLDDVYKTLDDFVERRKSRQHQQSTSDTANERCQSRTESVKEERSTSRPSKSTDSGRATPSKEKTIPTNTQPNRSSKGNDEEVKVSHNIVGNQRNIEVNSRKETKDGDCYTVREVKQKISVPAEADLDEVTSTLPTDCKEILRKAALNV